jgi:hypothetical protein
MFQSQFNTSGILPDFVPQSIPTGAFCFQEIAIETLLDSGVLHCSTDMRRRDKTLLLLNEFVARAGPVHLPSVACPPESEDQVLLHALQVQYGPEAMAEAHTQNNLTSKNA